MSETTPISRDELKQMRPETYLKPLGGFESVDDPRELAGNFATAACIAFEDAEASPQELLTVYEAIKQCLAMSEENNPSRKLQQSVEEALDAAGSLLNKEINGAIVAWVQECGSQVQTEKGIAAFMQHLSSVGQQYALIVSVKHSV